jgi:hypothetical protein
MTLFIEKLRIEYLGKIILNNNTNIFRAMGKWIHKITSNQKSRDTVPLTSFYLGVENPSGNSAAISIAPWQTTQNQGNICLGTNCTVNTSTRAKKGKLWLSPLWVCSSRRCNHRRSLVGRTSFYTDIPLSSLNKLKTEILKLDRGLARWLAGFESSPARHRGKSSREKKLDRFFNHMSSMKI